jgi:hypothetical protein
MIELQDTGQISTMNASEVCVHFAEKLGVVESLVPEIMVQVTAVLKYARTHREEVRKLIGQRG